MLWIVTFRVLVDGIGESDSMSFMQSLIERNSLHKDKRPHKLDFVKTLARSFELEPGGACTAVRSLLSSLTRSDYFDSTMSISLDSLQKVYHH